MTHPVISRPPHAIYFVQAADSFPLHESVIESGRASDRGLLAHAAVFEKVATGANGAYNQAERGDPAPEPKHVDVERVTSRGPFRPPGASQVVPAHDRTETAEEGVGQASFDRRQRHPRRVVAEHPVGIEGRRPRVVHGEPGGQVADPCRHVPLRRRDPDPVLQAVTGDGRALIVFEQQQPGGTPLRQLLAPQRVGWPAKKHDVHGK
jgi:hypothetical protein